MSFRRRSREEATQPTKTAPKTQAKKVGAHTYVPMGGILEKKDGGFYLALPKDSELEFTLNGEPIKYFNVEDPTAKFERFVQSGAMTEEEAQARIDKIPEYVIFEMTAVIEN